MRLHTVGVGHDTTVAKTLGKSNLTFFERYIFNLKFLGEDW